jgi:ABC-type multidrug transport system ATPase subunit/ABC-type multidrug transport system permease subunit
MYLVQDQDHDDDDLKLLGGETQGVVIHKVCKSYGKQEVLSNCSMAVERGQIYGLLGPSGSGKSTLLKCVLNRLSVSSGSIRVFGLVPGTVESQIPGSRVGYMPQEIALYGEFTLAETLRFNGKLHGMDSANIEERIEFFLEFLDLQGCRDQLVRTMSGGQQRRTSLAIAMFHDPELMILDEPTVGVDPLLRVKIWNFLVELSKSKGTTIIVTTHYIEEARKSDKVGLMMKGKLFVEGNPEDLLKQHEKSTLEDVFLLLCEHPDVFLDPNHDSVHEAETPLKRKTYCSVSRLPRFSIFLALLWGNLMRYVRMIPLLLFQFAVPALQVSLFCLAIGKDPQGLSLVVVNQDVGLPKSSINFGNVYSDTLKSISSINVLQMSSFPEAISTVKNGEAIGVAFIDSSFSHATFARYAGIGPVSEETIRNSTVFVSMDQSNSQNYLFVRAKCTLAFQETSRTLLKTLGRNPQAADSPVAFTEPIYGKKDPTFTDFIAPGMIINILFAQSMGLTALGIVIQKKEGTLDRLWAAGVLPSEVILAQSLTQIGIIVAQISLLLVVALVGFKIYCAGNVGWVLLLGIVLGMSGMMYGLFVSSFANDERTAIQITLSSFFPLLLLSGVIWPLEGIPKNLRYISYALPTTWAAEAMRSIFGRGWGIESSHVYGGFIACTAWLILFFVGSTKSLRNTD